MQAHTWHMASNGFESIAACTAAPTAVMFRVCFFSVLSPQSLGPAGGERCARRARRAPGDGGRRREGSPDQRAEGSRALRVRKPQLDAPPAASAGVHGMAHAATMKSKRSRGRRWSAVAACAAMGVSWWVAASEL